jgi:hypothetical protein
VLQLLQRTLKALPDAITATAYLSAWLFPLAWSPDLVRNLMLLMLLEFIVIHSNAFLMGTLGNDSISHVRRLFTVLGIGMFYLAFVGGFALAFDAWWPVWSFLWLLIAKWIGVFLRPRHAAEELAKQAGIWLSSVVLYLLAVFATTLLPVPAFGITDEVLAVLSLPGSGLWVEHPQTVVAAGLVYFSGLAVLKWRDRAGSVANPFSQ